MTTERFLTLADVAEILNISTSQTYALVRSGDLKGIQIGGRNQWRVERARLEEYINEAYERTAASLTHNRRQSVRGWGSLALRPSTWSVRRR